jgi:dTDP-4-amino-4,6-dideoxygalactose transaminase
MVAVLPSGVNRESVVTHMTKEGITTSVHFRPLHHLSWFQQHADIGASGTRVADELAPRALSLPLHPGLRVDQVDRVCDVLREALW